MVLTEGVKFPTRREFYEWAAGRKRLGVRGSMSSCPLAWYLKAAGFRGARVDGLKWTADNGPKADNRPEWGSYWWPLPRWAQRVAAYFDKTGKLP